MLVPETGGWGWGRGWGRKIGILVVGKLHLVKDGVHSVTETQLRCMNISVSMVLT